MSEVHRRDHVRARFFGDAPSMLFGTVHDARGAVVRDVGVVLCYPAPQEQRMVHWVFQRLADSLAGRGFAVLRFDYFACGDSWGESSAGSLSQWSADIQSATTFLRSASGVRRISLVGMRLGAALAVRAARTMSVRDLVLWDPVIDGSGYLRELECADARMRADQPYPVPAEPVAGELLGYPMSRAMREELGATNLLTTDWSARPRRVHLVAPTASASSASSARLVTHAQERGVVCTQEVVDDPQLYRPRADPVDTLQAHAGVQAIVTFLDGAPT